MPESYPRALCIIGNPALRRVLRRTLQAAGSTVEFVDSLDSLVDGQLDGDGPPGLVVIDADVRRSIGMPTIVDKVGSEGNLIMLGESLEDSDVVDIVRNNPLDHVITDAAADESEMVVTSVKLLSGDIFGLEKYLSWGVKVYDLSIASYEEKRISLLTVAEHAKTVGARRQVIAKIESVTDELLMNAMYDAPAVSRGEAPVVPTEPDARPVDPRATARLRYACDGRYFAVSVEDQYGELHKEAILDHVQRARAERGRPLANEGRGGAGLGLYFILSSVTRFIANVEPGKRTEVVCLFDLRQSGREAEACARSLHIFVNPDDRGDLEEEATRPG